MLSLLTDPHAWASLVTLTALEIVLGIDNIIFLSIVSGAFPQINSEARGASASPLPPVPALRCSSVSPGSSA